MSKAYRKWKEANKAHRRGEIPMGCIYSDDLSMASYRAIRRRVSRLMKEINRTAIQIRRMYGPGL